MPRAKIKAPQIDSTSFNGTADANGWTKSTNINGQTVYTKAGSGPSTTVPAGLSFSDYSITGPVGVTLSYTNCIVEGAFMSTVDRAVMSALYRITSTALVVACNNLYTGGGFTFTPTYQVRITML